MKIALFALASSLSAATIADNTVLCAVTFPEFPEFKDIGLCTSLDRCKKSNGFSTPGFCPGGVNNQCCRGGQKTASVPEICIVYSGEYAGSGVCVSTKKCGAAGGFSTKGFCPGTPNDIQCCRTKIE